MNNNNTSYAPIVWNNDKLYLLDQRLLPHTEKVIEINNLDGVIVAIRDMVVRGAPCIGFTAIFGMALWVKNQKEFHVDHARKACDLLIAARPTAVNLAFEVKRCFERMMMQVEKSAQIDLHQMFQDLSQFALLQLEQSEKKNLTMAQIALEHLAKVVPLTETKKKWKLMTHCNTGYLACGSLGTALGVITHAHRLQQLEYVIADETRPYMQGSRLTAFELSKEQIPYSIVVEGAASYLLSRGLVDAIFVGADRIAANGDTANKIGTSTLAIIAKHYGVPFYVVAPTSSFDLNLAHGDQIEIEMRPPEEITHFQKNPVSPVGAQVINPSFDVTSHEHITGIICEKGFIDPALKGEVTRVVTL